MNRRQLNWRPIPLLVTDFSLAQQQAPLGWAAGVLRPRAAGEKS